MKSVRWEDVLPEKDRLFVEASGLLVEIEEVDLRDREAMLKKFGRNVLKVYELLERLGELIELSIETAGK